jgi:hypothetical protein
MASTARTNEGRLNPAPDIEEDDTLTEVGEDRDFSDLDDETDALDRRRDPLRMPH